MRIIHVFDTAGIACILAKYQVLAGHDAKVVWNRGLIEKKDIYDKYGIYNYYQNYMNLYPSNGFLEALIGDCKNADIIHIHYNIDILAKLRKRLGPKKKIILHYHGTDIRGLSIRRIPRTHGSLVSEARNISRFMFRKIFHKVLHSKAQKSADLVFISQIDFLKLVPKAVYIPIAVDTEHFNASEEEHLGQKKDALTIKTEVTDIQLVLNYCKRNNLLMNIDVHDRTTRPLHYKEMPAFLKGYETYIDIRFVNGKILGDFSSTALQSLSCGLKVIGYDLNCLESFPNEHNASNVASRVLQIYKTLLEGQYTD